jgi:hypothetical protein
MRVITYDNESTDATVEDIIIIDQITNNDDDDAQRRHRLQRCIQFNSNYDNCSHSPPRPYTQFLLRRNDNDDDAPTTTNNSRIGRGRGRMRGRGVGIGICRVDATEEERYMNTAESSFSSASLFWMGL